MNINDLRAEVARRQKAAQAKMTRLRKKGVQIQGTEFDVRRDPARVSRYNSRQLQGYLNDLNQFTNRRTSFVAGSEGVPIRAHVFNHAMRTAREYNDYVNAYYDRIKDTNMPQLGMTVAELDKDVKSTRRAKGGVSRPLQPDQREAFEFASEKGLIAWRDSLEQKMRPGYMDKKTEFQRRQMDDALSVFGDREITDLANNLTDEQFDTLWNYTDAPRDMFSGYHFIKALSTGRADETEAAIHEDGREETLAWLQWASTLPPRENGKNRK